MTDVVAEAIDDIKVKRGGVRQYIGASGIGNACNAYLAFCLRGYPDNDVAPQLSRIILEGNPVAMIPAISSAKLSIFLS